MRVFTPSSTFSAEELQLDTQPVQPALAVALLRRLETRLSLDPAGGLTRGPRSFIQPTLCRWAGRRQSALLQTVLH